MFKLALSEMFSDTWDIVTSEYRSNLIVMASYDKKSDMISVRCGNFKKLQVPLSWFGTNSNIDPNRLSIRDCGQTLALGEYEVDVTAILENFN